MAPAQPIQSSAADYRRQARRLRWKLAGAPHRLQPALLQLARQHNGSPSAHGINGTLRLCAHEKSLSRCARASRHINAQRPPILPPSFSHPAADAFCRLVREKLPGQILRYSTRQSLIRQATNMGLGRFQANLIIATVQHQQDNSPSFAPSHSPRCSNRFFQHLPSLLIAAAIQALILLAAWSVIQCP